MLDNMIKDLVCPVCEEGDLSYDHGATFKAFNDIFELEDVVGIVDGVIEQFLVFNCLNCGTKVRLTYKEIEKMLRKDITKRILTLKASGELDRGLTVRNRYYIYCGMCSGFDGRGSCPKVVYDNCNLKKVPNVI